MVARDNSSPWQNTWEAAFTAIDNSPNPYTAVRFVPKSTVRGVPARFRQSTSGTLFPTYREQTIGDSFVIREIGPVYVVTKSGGGDVTPITDRAISLFDNPTGTSPNPRDGPSDLFPQSGNRSGNSVTTGQAILGAFAVYAGYKGLEAIASQFGSAIDETPSESTPSPEFSRLARAASRLEDKQFNIFVSHSWSYDSHYERIVEFLDEVPSLEWQNHSVPSDDPLDVTTDAALEAELRKQMRTASVVVVSAGMYGAYSKWIPRELELADELGKPVIAIVPEGQEQTPTDIQEVADEIVGWRKASLIDALADHG